MYFKLKSILATLILLFLSMSCAFAQDPGTPCDEIDLDDPAGCPVPLDTWVMFLVIVAVIYGAYYLNKKQKEALS
ncbi:hypothetical protein [Mucilaginibacter psychrotolerans]|uniref:hypothetical protein n=1 Tax=Mucilaginibacter psychrotolerans TaxID=1524096 RepID=UPI001057F457|nr:hypothetical protein [Mucilaginibacter psychrotolerans]